MISIAGLGVAGSYLSRRLVEAGFQVKSFDPKVAGYYVPCGYATNRNRLAQLLKNVGLEPDDYVEKVARNVIFANEAGRELEFSTSGLCTIDKNRLESDLVGSLQFERRKAVLPEDSRETFIDATGVSRYYLGAPEKDFLMNTKEYLSGTASHEEFYFRYFSSGRGYYWEFPLKNGYHVGAGGDSQEIVNHSLGWVTNPIRVMSRKIRLKPLFDEISNGNIIGVGEAIGTVSPITGEGILPSMECAEILFNQITKFNDIESLKENYEREVKRTFSRFPRLFDLLLDARRGELRQLRNLSAIRSAREDLENFGIEFKLGKVLRQLAFT